LEPVLPGDKYLGQSWSRPELKFELPHTHSEVEPVFFDLSSPLSASGGQRDDSAYTVFVSLQANSDGSDKKKSWRLVASPLHRADERRMYATFESEEELRAALEDKLHLPEQQVTGIISTGGSEIGGHFNATRIFYERDLYGSGLTFTPPEDIPL